MVSQLELVNGRVDLCVVAVIPGDSNYPYILLLNDSWLVVGVLRPGNIKGHIGMGTDF